jgi:hypothetical protein
MYCVAKLFRLSPAHVTAPSIVSKLWIASVKGQFLFHDTIFVYASRNCDISQRRSVSLGGIFWSEVKLNFLGVDAQH